jgi:hypothetical protein
MKQFSGGQFAAQFSCITVEKAFVLLPDERENREMLHSRHGSVIGSDFCVFWFPLAARRLVTTFFTTQKPILNSSFQFREGDFMNNARC